MVFISFFFFGNTLPLLVLNHHVTNSKKNKNNSKKRNARKETLIYNIDRVYANLSLEYETQREILQPEQKGFLLGNSSNSLEARVRITSNI